jgi:DNA polymerase delta subunit 1
VFSQLLRETRKQGFLVPTINRYGEAKDDESFEGATVLTPMKGIYTEPITVCDFESLYPSIIRAHNLCFSTIILDDSQINESVEYETISWDQSDIKYSFKFVQNTPGILPKLLSELAGSRKRYKKMMKEAKDPFLKEVYNKSQLAVKVSMNSIYGFLAAPMLCCKPIAATVTAVGRDMIKKTKNYIEEKYPSVCVYGDTDSVMVKFTTKTTQKYLEAVNSGSKDIERMRCICIKESIDLGKIVAKKVTEDLFKSPINLEYEKIFCPMLLLSKKRYIGKLYSDDPSKFDKMDNKGVVLTRRDNTSLLKKVYKKIVDILLESGNRGIGEVLEYVNTVLYQILNGEIDIDDIIISKTFKTTYKNKNIPHVVLVDKIKQRGGDVRSNERVPYVFVEKIEYTIRGKPKKLSQYHKVEDPEYVKEHKIPLDAEYYIKSMMNPICEVLELFMENPEEIFKSVIQEYKNSRW